MKKNNITSTLGVIGLAVLVGISSLFAQDAKSPEAATTKLSPKLTDAEVKTISSYALGLRAVHLFADSGLIARDIDTDGFLKGFLAGFRKDKPEYGEARIRVAMESLRKVVQDRLAKVAEKNLAEGKAFLEKNSKRDVVTTTASGLQYEVIKKGTDKKYVAPANGAADGRTRFLVHYRGTLIDGTEFDKSREGKPFPMTLQVIPGFREALTTMPVGSKWRLFLPSSLAYGSRGSGSRIAANSTLIFELELVDIQTASTSVPPPPTPPKNPVGEKENPG